MKYLLCAALALVHICAAATGAEDCLPILKAKDYSSYASEKKLNIDYLSTVDRQTWETAQNSNDLSFMGVFPAGVFNLSDSYNQFDAKRTSYFEQIHYKRNQSQSLQIIQMTTSPRAYDKYSECLHAMNGAGILVWAERADMETVTVRVRYANPSGQTEAYLKASVTGGSVNGAPAGKLWSPEIKIWPFPFFHQDDALKFGVNEERTFVVNRAPGTSSTTITVSMENGTGPVTYTSQRADGMISAEYVGTTDVLRQSDHRDQALSPNNDHNHGSCPNEVGRENGVCVSKTEVITRVNSPLILKNARATCDGGGCGFTDGYGSGGVVWYENDSIAHATLRNWSVPVTIWLHTDVYQRVGAADCAIEGPIPVIFGQEEVVNIKSECLPISVLHYRLFSDNSAGNMQPKEISSNSSPITLVRRADLGTASTFTVRLAASAKSAPSLADSH